MSALNVARRRLLGIPLAETTFQRRGFRAANVQAQQRLEQIGRAFVDGYHIALDHSDCNEISGRLELFEGDLRGFGYEGASMALALLDGMTPWKVGRLPAFLSGPAVDHVYMVHVGAGWAAARLPWTRRRIGKHIQRYDPLLRWLVVDGFGFHEGYFHPNQSVWQRRTPKRLTGYAARAFDQGLGRSLWFVHGADIEQIAETIARFAHPRRADLWSGVGLACTYAGGIDLDSIERLSQSSSTWFPHFAQGVVFAATARCRAGISQEHTRSVCQMIWGRSPTDLRQLADKAAIALPFDDPIPAYEHWRERIRHQFEVSSAARFPVTTGHAVSRSL